MRFFTAIASICLLACSLAAHADTFSGYKINGTLQDGGVVAGTILIDAGPYITNITSVDIVADGVLFKASTADGSSINITTTRPLFQNGDGTGNPYAEVQITNSFSSLYLLITPSSGGYALCTTANSCNGDYTRMTNTLNYGNSAISGSLAVLTPEPSGFVLLGTGVGLVGAARRRFLKS